MTKAMLLMVRLGVLSFFAFPLTLFGQAAIEYAMKTGTSLPTGERTAIAGCQVDSALLTCLGHAHPRGAILGGAVLLFLLVRWLGGSGAFRTR
jgi:hypothetical protein